MMTLFQSLPGAVYTMERRMSRDHPVPPGANDNCGREKNHEILTYDPFRGYDFKQFIRSYYYYNKRPALFAQALSPR